MLTPVTGEDWQWQHFITVENCGDDFLTAFVEAIQITENYDDLEVIEELSCKYSFVQSFCVVASSSIIHYKRAGRMVVLLI